MVKEKKKDEIDVRLEDIPLVEKKANSNTWKIIDDRKNKSSSQSRAFTLEKT